MGRTIGVYFDDALLEKGQAKAAAQGGKFSTYIQRLIESDLANEAPKPLSPTVIVDLTKTLSGELDAKAIAQKLGNADQPKLLRGWLRDYIEKNDEVESEHLDIRGEFAKQEPIARRTLREKFERRQKREDGSETA